MQTREVQEEEGDEADQSIPEDEQPTRPTVDPSTKVARTAAWHTETRRRVICNLPDTFLDWVSLIPRGTKDLMYHLCCPSVSLEACAHA